MFNSFLLNYLEWYESIRTNSSTKNEREIPREYRTEIKALQQCCQHRTHCTVYDLVGFLQVWISFTSFSMTGFLLHPRDSFSDWFSTYSSAKFPCLACISLSKRWFSSVVWSKSLLSSNLVNEHVVFQWITSIDSMCLSCPPCSTICSWTWITSRSCCSSRWNWYCPTRTIEEWHSTWLWFWLSHSICDVYFRTSSSSSLFDRHTLVKIFLILRMISFINDQISSFLLLLLLSYTN